MTELRVMSVVGARPNFMKIAPFIRAIERHNAALTASHPPPAGDACLPPIRHILVHSGQHYDAQMSDAFFSTLGIPPADIHLGVGSGSHAEQVGRTMVAVERAVADAKPDWLVVVGDVNATCAASITAKKQHVRLAHIEAGLRSFDMAMPEEINRIVTDRLSDLLFTTDEIADSNLAREGTEPARIRRVGNIMIDTLEANRERASAMDPEAVVASMLSPLSAGGSGPTLTRAAGEYALLTLHRPSNVDDPGILARWVDFLIAQVATRLPLLWTLHPRTEKNLAAFGLLPRLADNPRVVLLRPLDYLQMLRLSMSAKVALTDSGGLQEECCVLGTPCLTLRANTERPKTLMEHGGTNVLAGTDPACVSPLFLQALTQSHTPHRPDLWDGHAAERIVRELAMAPGDRTSKHAPQR